LLYIRLHFLWLDISFLLQLNTRSRFQDDKNSIIHVHSSIRNLDLQQLTISSTGATGYIGGSVLTKIIPQFPDLEITALLRSTTQEFLDKYPDVKIVKGTFDDYQVIEKASAESDIIIRTSPFRQTSFKVLTNHLIDAGDSDHEGCVKAILSGLSHKTSKKQKSFLIHLSGTGVISDEREQTWEGKSNPKIWDDIKDIDEINNLPENAKHHKVDRWIQEASDEYLKTVIVCPPDIYGEGYAVGGRTSFLVPMYVDALIKHGEAFYLGDGDNLRAVAHIDDVIEVFSLLVGEALKGGGNGQWGDEVSIDCFRVQLRRLQLIFAQGFYFTVTEEVRWKDAAMAINCIGIQKGWRPKDSDTVSWNAEKLDAAFPGYPAGMILYLWGSNSRASSSRAKLLGWQPKASSFWYSLAADVDAAVQKAL